MSKRILLVVGTLLALGVAGVGVALWMGGASDPPVPATGSPAPASPVTPVPQPGAPSPPAPLPGAQPGAQPGAEPGGESPPPPAPVDRRRSPERADEYGMDAREFLLARSRSAKLGGPQSDWQQGSFGGFELATLGPPSKEAYQKQVEIAKKIKELLKRDKVVASAHPVVFYPGPQKGKKDQDVGEVGVPVLEGSKVTPPLKLRRVETVKVWATEAVVENEVNDAWGAAAEARFRAAGMSFASPQQGVIRYEHPEPWTQERPRVRYLMIVN